MSYNRHHAVSGLPTGERRYLNQQSPQTRQMDLFSANKVTELNSLAGHWEYDSTIDLFSFTPVGMDTVSCQFPDSLAGTDTKDLYVDPFAISTAFGGFNIPPAEDAASVSSDLDSDDQPWSTGPYQLFSIPAQPTSNNDSTSLNTRPPPSHSTTSSRWSSSPEMRPQELIPQKPTNPPTPRSSRKTRSHSQDSNHSSTSQDPHLRNAAKRAAHNVIEKRYRTNMNAKFLALERVISPSSGSSQKRSASAGAGCLKKSEILTNALAYIESVREENDALREELACAKQRFVPDCGW